MRKPLLLVALLLAAASCRKEASVPVSSPSGMDYLHMVVAQLRDSLPAEDIQRLDTSRGYLDRTCFSNLNFLRIPFRDAPMASAFVIVRMDGQGKVAGGRIVELVNEAPGGPNLNTGSIILRSLSGSIVLQSRIAGGYIVALHPNLQRPVGVTTFELAQGGDDDGDGGTQEFPPVYVYPSPGQGSDEGGADLASLSGEDGSGAAIGALNPSGGGGAGGTGVSAATALPAPAEYSNNLNKISIAQFFNCFNQVPDVGATYTLSLCTDVPDNNDPGALFDLATGNSTIGHSFLVVTKTNGSSSITQCFGFYPAQTPSYWNPMAPVPSQMKDNGGHEINASVTISISASQFAVVQSNAISDATMPYELESDNCTDYADGIFNSVSPTQINCVPIQIEVEPGPADPPETITIQNSPQGLFSALTAMKASGGPLASNISTDLSGNTKSPASHGECTND
jgi:hypothetical protein